MQGPIDDNVVFNVTINNYATFFNYTLAQWQGYTVDLMHTQRNHLKLLLRLMT